MMTPTSDDILNAFTVDVEDYFHVQAFADRIDPRRWDDYESRVVANTHRLLRILDGHQVRGTFFVLGWVADRFPQLVRDIQRSGHEIGCHGFWHGLIYNMTPDEFREDLLHGAKAVEEITGQRVVAFRAPSFSITQKSLWALEVLMEQGFKYDSSIFPVHHDNYGIPGAPRFPYRITPNGHSFSPLPPPGEGLGVRAASPSLLEFPPTVHRLWKFNIPIAGGGYFRLYPVRLSIHWLRCINRRHNQPFMFYIHPWELDPDQPRLPASPRSRFRHYQNLRKTEGKLHVLLSAFRFGRITETLGRGLQVNSGVSDKPESAHDHGTAETSPGPTPYASI